MIMKKIIINKFNLLLAILALLFLFSGVNPAYSFDVKGEGCTTDCIQCHDIDKDEAAELLKGLVEKVVSVEEGPVRGVWEVEVEVKGNTFPVYLHYSKKYIIAGNVIDIKTKERVGKTPRPAKPAVVDMKSVPLEDTIVIGDQSAENKIIVFDDPDCPFCRKFHPVMKEVISRRKDIAFHIKLFPLVQLHPQAYDKAKAIVCEKSLKLLDDAFTGKPVPPPTCETDQIDRNIELASSLGISGTPTLIFKDGQIVPGYIEADKLIEIVDSLDADNGSGK
jgi:thiol:disulfide interchange protein DsbC